MPTESCGKPDASLSVYMVATSHAAAAQHNPAFVFLVDALWPCLEYRTMGKAVSPPSWVEFDRYNNTVATLGEPSTRES